VGRGVGGQSWGSEDGGGGEGGAGSGGVEEDGGGGGRVGCLLGTDKGGLSVATRIGLGCGDKFSPGFLTPAIFSMHNYSN